MDRLGLAGLPDHRDGTAASNGRGADLCSAVCPVHAGGIAGEDDLDAPNLIGPGSKTESLSIESKSVGNGGRPTSSNRTARRSRMNKYTSPSPATQLSVVLSASLRAELLREIEELSAPDDAALWAQRRLPAKNQLSATDARHVEDVFAGKVAVIQAQSAKSDDDVLSEQSLAESTSTATQITKDVLVFLEQRRIRDRDHLRHMIKQACLVCGRRPSDPHHLRFAQSRALGRKVSDEFTVPLCRAHHREVHRCGDEGSWWRKTGIDPRAAARAFWLETHPLPRAEAAATSNEATYENHAAPVIHE